MRKKTDGNHQQLLKALRSIPGVSVVDLSAVGQGCPDILVGYHEKNYLFEIKNPLTKGKLNPRQTEWFADWRGQASVITNADDLIEALGWKPF